MAASISSLIRTSIGYDSRSHLYWTLPKEIQKAPYGDHAFSTMESSINLQHFLLAVLLIFCIFTCVSTDSAFITDNPIKTCISVAQ